MQGTSESTINDPRRNSLASRPKSKDPATACNTEGPNQFPGTGVAIPPEDKHARLSTLAVGVNSETLVRSPRDGPAAFSSAAHSHRCHGRASTTGRFPGARRGQAHAEGLAEWGAGCRVLVLRCR